ncbi:MAG: 16S rRNA (uracil(1498)-N(3))-methyltransferase [Candidatus Marinimicrobia bacterium]|nr:16S rRNA (uracil(1498)-N(3))-methyltransferase [Candidatus Neomarinimicrobiota bacterium]MCH7955267.1 16S rRNA (uracil(1498)-N(3))-methyltransferase [Candidatus Neomarinimicrobiota bacterium]
MDSDYFFVEPSNVTEDELTLIDAEAHHIQNVIRKHEGDSIMAVNGNGVAYKTIIENIQENSIVCSIVNTIEGLNEPSFKLALGIGLLKSTHLEDTLNSCIQLGISELIPLLCARSIKKNINLRRFETISMTAMKQTGRCVRTLIHEPVGIEELLTMTAGYQLKLISMLGESLPLLYNVISEMNAEKFKNGVILVGPEGDFTDEEITCILENGFEPVSLGKRRLRSETAASAAVSLIMSHFEERDLNYDIN